MQWLLDQEPHYGEDVFIAPGARVLGAVTLGEESSVFYNTVLRADINSIVIGARTNIQDNCTVHVSDAHGVRVGDGVTVGHQAILHGCTVADNVMVGMGCILLDGATIDPDCLIAAGSLVPRGSTFAAGSLVMGRPARLVRSLSAAEIEANRATAAKYVRVQGRYRARLAAAAGAPRGDGETARSPQ
jgi:carbonic anhydrase/acetyltransferase-like protein (isoleucine patch superfamily)